MDLSLIGRSHPLFESDIAKHEAQLVDLIKSSRFLIIGGAGTIGQAVVKEVFKRSPKVLHVVDISENNLVELVRDIRSSAGYISGEFLTLPLDSNSKEFAAFIRDKQYDYVLNLSALKHVRSEKDPFTLMRLIQVNILNTDQSIEQAIKASARKYFCVSTDKATNPVNLMGASKLIMEMFLYKHSFNIDISTARFANVAFSDGSLLYSFEQRINKRQPLSAPNDIKRYFVTKQESGQLCLMSCLLGQNKEIFFPKLNDKLHLITFSDIAVNYLQTLGYTPYICESEEEARQKVEDLVPQKKWPCYFFESDTTGEKDFEEFYVGTEILDFDTYSSIGVMKEGITGDIKKVDQFKHAITTLQSQEHWTKQELVDLFNDMIPNFNHLETHKYLDNKM